MGWLPALTETAAFVICGGLLLVTGIWSVLSHRWNAFVFGSVCTLILLQLSTTYQPVGLITGPVYWIGQHPVLTIGLFLAYFAVGVVVAVLKWRSLIDSIKDDIAAVELDAKTINYKNERRVGEIKEVFYKHTGYRHAPKIAEQKSRFFNWATFWFIVGPWTLLNDPVRRFYSWVYARIGARLQSMSDRAFTNVDLNDRKTLID